MDRQEFSALKVAYSDQEYFVIVCSAQWLRAVCRVSRADEDPQKGYQRLLSESRAKKIAEHFENDKLIPGALIVSATSDAAPRYNPDESVLSLASNPGSCLVIDGQHRLYGASQVERDIFFPVCLFKDLDLAEEVELFVDINSRQRGVPRTLQLEIQKFITADEPTHVRLKLFRRLDTTDSSPLKGRMSATKSVTGKLSHVPFEKAIGPLFEWQTFSSMDFEKKYKFLENYLTAVNIALPPEFQKGKQYKLSNAAFFQAIFFALRSVAATTLERFGNFKIESFAQVLEPIEAINWNEHSGTNRAAINSLADEIIYITGNRQTVTDDML